MCMAIEPQKPRPPSRKQLNPADWPFQITPAGTFAAFCPRRVNPPDEINPIIGRAAERDTRFTRALIIMDEGSGILFVHGQYHP